MNSIYIGDRQLDPPDNDECPFCEGVLFTEEWDVIDQIWYQVDCSCQHEPDPEPEDHPCHP